MMNAFKNILCVGAGALLPLAFAPEQWWWLAIISPTIFLYSLTDQLNPMILTTPKRGALRGFLFGFSFFGIGASWVYISIHTYGNTNIFLASLITFLFLLILAAFFTLLGWLQCRFFKSPSLLWITFPSLGVLMEAFLGKFFTGFPWLFLGYSQTVSPLKGYIPLLGVYGISFLVYFSSALLFFCFFAKSFYKWISASILLLMFVGGYLLAPFQWTHADSDPLNIALIQGNIPQQLKWDATYAQHIVDTYLNLSATYWQEEDLLVWPEGAIPVPLPISKPFTSVLDNFANHHQATLITGIPTQRQNSNTFYNSMLAIGQTQGIYHK